LVRTWAWQAEAAMAERLVGLKEGQTEEKMAGMKVYMKDCRWELRSAERLAVL
jgi:hypothetical protein